MKNIFNLDNKFFQFMSKITDLVVLNVLFIMTSIPVITIGASATALYLTVEDIRNKDEGHLYRDYFIRFKDNLFSKKTLEWLLIITSQVMLLFDLWLTRYIDLSYRSLIVGILYGVELLFMLFSSFMFFVNGKGKTLKDIICETVLVITRSSYWSIVMLVITFFPIASSIIFPQCIPAIAAIYVFIGFAGMAYIQAVVKAVRTKDTQMV